MKRQYSCLGGVLVDVFSMGGRRTPLICQHLWSKLMNEQYSLLVLFIKTTLLSIMFMLLLVYSTLSIFFFWNCPYFQSFYCFVSQCAWSSTSHGDHHNSVWTVECRKKSNRKKITVIQHEIRNNTITILQIIPIQTNNHYI